MAMNSNDAKTKALIDRLFMGQGLMQRPRQGLLAQGLMDYQSNPVPPQYRASGLLNSVGAGPVQMTEPGNIDIFNRPQVPNADGSISTVRSMSMQDEQGNEVLVPTVAPNGTYLTPQQAWRLYLATGKHLGKFPNQNAATHYANALHNQQDAFYSKRKKP